MFKPVPLCKVCKAVQADKKLLERINHSKSFVAGGESLTSIQQDNADKFVYLSLLTHVKKHQAPKKSVLNRRVKAKQTKDALKTIEASDDSRVVALYTNHSETRRNLIQKTLEAVERGDTKMTSTNLVALLAQEQKAEESAKDRGLKMMEMFNYFASGAGKIPPRTTRPPIEEGELA